MNTKIKNDDEKNFWLKIDRENKIFQSTKIFLFGGFIVVSFSYEFVKLCLEFSNYNEFKNAIQTTEKSRVLGFLLAIIVGVLLIWVGIKVRRSPLSDKPRRLP